MKKVLVAVLMFFPIVIFALGIVLVDGCIQFMDYVSSTLKEILNDKI